MNYKQNMTIKRDRDWVTDYTFDFSADLPNVVKANVTVADGLIAGVPQMSPPAKAKVRISGGAPGQKYAFKITAEASNGEVRPMNLIFVIT